MPEASARARTEAAAAERPQVETRSAIAVLAAALLASVVVPGSRAGLGLALASQAVLIAAAIASTRRPPWAVAMLGGAAVLAAAPVLRDAAWVVSLDLLVALAITVIALISADSLLGYARGAVTIIFNFVIGPLEVLRSAVARVPAIGPGGLASLARAGLITAGLLVVFIPLFASADPAFAQLYDDLTPGLTELYLEQRIGVILIALAVGGALVLLAGWRDEGPPAAEPSRSLGTLEWGIALSALVLVFAGFVSVQFVVLFGGQDHVLQTAGLTYAEYARQGFAQLIVAAVLVLAVIAAALRLARVDRKRQRLLLHSLLAALAVLTLVVLASAAHRLDLYVDAFGATRARLQAIAGCALIAGSLALVIVGLFTRQRSWLTPGIATVVAVVALGLTVVNPDGLVARRNVERYQNIGRFDPGYNAGLSADAVPALSKLPPALANDVLQPQLTRLERPDGFWGTNLGRSRARNALAEQP